MWETKKTTVNLLSCQDAYPLTDCCLILFSQAIRPHTPLIKFPNRQGLPRPNGESLFFPAERMCSFRFTFIRNIIVNNAFPGDYFITLLFFFSSSSPGGIENISTKPSSTYCPHFSCSIASVIKTACTFNTNPRHARHTGLYSATSCKVPQETVNSR